MSLLLPAAYLAKKLTQPLPTKAGNVLRTIADASNYMLALPDDHAELCTRWRRAAQLLLDQADVAAVSRQVKLVLFFEAKLDQSRASTIIRRRRSFAGSLARLARTSVS